MGRARYGSWGGLHVELVCSALRCDRGMAGTWPTDPTIDALLASEHTKRLKIHRNATCHFQNAVWVEKWNHFEREPGAVDWVRSLDNAFGRYFLGQTKLYAEGVLKDDTVPAEAKQMTTQFLAMLRDRGAGDDPAA